MPPSTGPLLPPPEIVDVEVQGNVPTRVSGRMVGIGPDGVAHSVFVNPARGSSYHTQLLRTEKSVQNMITFGGTILALSHDSPAYALSVELDTFGVVDLAGQGRVLAPFPKIDQASDELHVVARSHDGTQSHITVTSGALTRRARTILDVPQRITDLGLTSDSVVFVASGLVGIAPREGEARTTWIATGAPAPHLVHAHDGVETVVLFVLTPLLERWTVHSGTGSIVREVVDPTRLRFAHVTDDGAGGAPRWIWTTGHETIRRHDLIDSRSVHHNVGPYVPGDFVVLASNAAQADGADGTDGGWLIGLVHDPSGVTTDLRVFDAADVARPAVATVHIPRPMPHGLRCTWIPSTQQQLTHSHTIDANQRQRGEQP